MKNKIRQSQEKLFKKLYNQHKGSSMAVSSESWVHKDLRFSKISELFRDESEIQVHDIGMGLGSFYGYFKKTFPDKKLDYSGSEILSEFVNDCKVKIPNCKFYLRDLSEKPGKDTYDYVIMSGVFHQRRNSNIGDWERFSQHLLKNSFSMCKKGMAFNFISPFVDFYQPEVYYCNLPKLLNYINDELSRFFIIQHDYALFEFTVFVYQEKHIKSKYQEKEFQKYFKTQ